MAPMSGGGTISPIGMRDGKMSQPNFHNMEDTSVHYESTKSLVDVGEVAAGGTNTATTTI